MNSISVIVLTYNWPEALDRVLESIKRQTVTPVEVIVADDGSGDETRGCIKRWQSSYPIPLRHVWQPDQGFRAASARNRAAAEAVGDYLVFIDGDCLAFSDFVRNHQALREKHYFVAGRRLLIDDRLSHRILNSETDPVSWSGMNWAAARLRGHVNRLLPLVRLPDGGWRKSHQTKWQGVQSCNLAVWARDFAAVNGFDESFQGWGHEDADLAVRLIRHNVHRKTGRFSVPVIHLWHPEQRRDNEKSNFSMLEQSISGHRPVFAKQGLSGYQK